VKLFVFFIFQISHLIFFYFFISSSFTLTSLKIDAYKKICHLHVEHEIIFVYRSVCRDLEFVSLVAMKVFTYIYIYTYI